MARLIACVFLILGMVTAMDRSLAAALGSLLLKSQDRFIALYRPDTAPADVVILGNSRADNHFPPDTVAKLACGSTVNLGMGGAPTVVSAALWEDYLDRHPAPKLLILEPTSIEDDPAVLADAPMLSTYSPRIDALVRQADANQWAWNQAFHLLTFNSNQTLRLMAGMLSEGSRDRTLDGVMSAAQKAQLDRAPEEVWDMYPANLAALDRIIATAQSRGVTVAVAITPLYGPLAAKIRNYDDFFATLAAHMPPGVTVLDLRGTATAEEQFTDPMHINRAGVERMMTALADPLHRLGCGEPGGMIARLPAAPLTPAPISPAPISPASAVAQYSPPVPTVAAAGGGAP
ncbi:hypothetical protein M2352_003320 [Azospirillum fermentarium]|uniref:hypothetical protein n=1 Tax=Azospirillum fermentarium TaxID=1233114 RepID=UPI002227DCE1|nr:hypothetical protein [Azospirillum fermentarium]MCW2247686.1 hypothetical protein [Azospirillum fermentarium]